eukprot:TRINITY_DN21552_c0_g1_i1.p1 TRINITY_DN21552_c0_g1~~TRINITY_DN21552_c0_g1_i1.p1  ORF type:complete len:515 (+),score=34.18 TRINITY_DN21552_c0_g1_i1:98-1642(+)
MDSTYIVAALAIIFFSVIYNITMKSKNGGKEAPQPAGAWPVLGHIPLLLKVSFSHRSLGDLADKYGPAYKLRVGWREMFVVSNWQLAKECLSTNDRKFANRPLTVASKLVGWEYAIFSLSPLGDHWRDTRKLAVHQLLSNTKLEALEHVWYSEIDMFVKDFYQLWRRNGENPVGQEMKERLFGYLFNINTRMVAGKRFYGTKEKGEEAKDFIRVTDDVLHLLAAQCVGDAFPFMQWVDFFGQQKAMKKTNGELDAILQSWVDEKRLKRPAPGETKDFMDILVSMASEGKLPSQSHYSPDTFIKAACFTTVAGGTETTATELIWCFSLLLSNTSVLKKAQAELDAQVGRDRRVEKSDIGKLVYLHAIVKETLRLYPAGPLLLPHEATEDCEVGGYTVKAGTALLVNAWKIHRDPNVYSDPNAFRPERFLEQNIDLDVWGKQFELIPFGSGRRSCVGASMAMQVMLLSLAHLLHSFDWAAPPDAPVDLTEGLSLNLPKLNPLNALVTPRLPSKLYE